eukprot:scaffold4396_cov145-Skeletonema_marinoi.AAC.6
MFIHIPATGNCEKVLTTPICEFRLRLTYPQGAPPHIFMKSPCFDGQIQCTSTRITNCTSLRESALLREM